MTQRELARRAGVPQPTVARIEGEKSDPRTRTLARLLAACGKELSLSEIASGVDRSAIRELLRLSPAARARLAVEEARNLEKALAGQ